MAQIKLTQGFFATVDDGDEDAVKAMGSWCVQRYKTKQREIFYAKTSIFKCTVLLHRFIMHRDSYLQPAASKKVDHINGNGLDCRKENLRIVGASKNAFNSTNAWAHNTSGRKGVYWSAQKHKWHAEITVFGKKLSLGFYDSFAEAVLARERSEKRIWDDNNSPL